MKLTLSTKRARFSLLAALPGAFVGMWLGFGMGWSANEPVDAFHEQVKRTLALERYAEKLEAEGETMDDPQYAATKRQALEARAILEKRKSAPPLASLADLRPFVYAGLGMIAGFAGSFVLVFGGLSLLWGMIRFVWKG